MQFNRISTAAAALTAAWSLAACAANQRPTTVESGGEVAAAAVTPTDNRTIPTGAMLTTTLDQSLGTGSSHTGDAFSATVSNALYASDGSLVVPSGARIDGHVTALQTSSNAAEPALIRLNFDRISFNGRTYPFAANIAESSPVTTSSSSNADRNRKIIIGGAVGAALGAIVGGKSVDKIVIGGALGAAVGSIISLGTDVNATLPAGSQMTVQATQTTVLR